MNNPKTNVGWIKRSESTDGVVAVGLVEPLRLFHPTIPNGYLNAEKRTLVAVVENLWDKYAVSSRELEQARSETLKVLDGFLDGFGYLGSS